jgi:two-component system cell cycle response regulator CpdR
MRALVVDDNETVRDLVCRVLEGCGFELVVAAGGAQALQHLAQGGLDLVVTDWHMPGLKGSNVVSAARELLLGTPVLVVSGDPRAALEGVDPGDPLVHLLPKPFTVSELVALVERVVPPAAV